MKRLSVVSLVVLAVVLGFGCKKSTAPGEGGGGNGGGGGGGGGGPTPTPESTAAYFGITPDSSFIYWDSTTTTSSGTSLDTVQTIFYPYITSGSELLVPHKDTFFTMGRVFEDTFRIKGDTVYQDVKIVIDTSVRDTISFTNLLGIKPLTIGQTWTPIQPFTQPMSDTIFSPLFAGCTLGIRLDSFKITSSSAQVIDTLSITVPAGTFSAYRVIYERQAKIHYGLFTVPTGCAPISGDTNGELYSYDTTYIKPYYGMVLIQGRDSSVFHTPMGSQTELTGRYRALTGKR